MPSNGPAPSWIPELRREVARGLPWAYEPDSRNKFRPSGDSKAIVSFGDKGTRLAAKGIRLGVLSEVPGPSYPKTQLQGRRTRTRTQTRQALPQLPPFGTTPHADRPQAALARPAGPPRRDPLTKARHGLRLLHMVPGPDAPSPASLRGPSSGSPSESSLSPTPSKPTARTSASPRSGTAAP
ncbi:hypothetical protein DL764_003495 [Monosporascus ibericus]|uniref:Uncharacterized protein n=1 Tax=Monosporascus ibericus TaxID=155417 RepID=A0A4Q4TIV2_9PEZI|nr:hypothetical protein DL764_003495 [Monosporascus ibericus]